MSENYTGRAQDRRYEGTAVDITYNIKRCIHAAVCVNRLATVFDVDKRPWINADGAVADELVAVVGQCPSGALHTERKDGGADETAPDTNTVTVQADGPLEIHGDIALEAAGVAIADEFRVTLCRCGASANKPFCDNAHKNIEFSATEIDPITTRTAVTTNGGKLTIVAHANGPLELSGDFSIINADNETLFAGDKTWLCRCGGSARKPFCDGTHKTNGFASDQI